MIVKKSGKTVYGAELTAAEKKALDMEARRALAEHTRKHELEIEAMVMRQVRRSTGWGKIKLKRFYMDFAPDIMALVKRYEMDEVDMPWLCTQELKEEGFDIEAWHREAYPNEKYDVTLK
jgi:hypothetical protein